jgi:threonyl-tRNA synthetase
MAQAVKELFPDVHMGIGPVIKDGFYYDFERKEPFTDEDLAQIEKRMKDIVQKASEFKHEDWAKEKAIDFFSRKNEPFKCELIREIPGDSVSIYHQGPFTDLCRGPHVANTKEVKALKVLHVSGAYWRGKSENPVLQRIYGTAFQSQKELDDYLNRLEEAKKRDHRKLGKELDLFSFHEEAPGMPFFHPKGMSLYQNLVQFWKEKHAAQGYLEIKTPLIMREELWKQSGHYDHYRDHMYFTSMEGANFAVKPMNCPGSNLVYKQSQRSYRDLPMRLAELGQVHRHELSGVMHGLFRVKTFTIDDTHIYCTEDQIREEISKVIRLILEIYQTFDFKGVEIELSTRPQESMGSAQMWEKAESSLKQALEDNQIKYKLNPGDGAFYGPKIDFHILDSLERSWQCGTIQLDFSMPERFKLEYIGSDGAAHQPVMIHRAVFGSVERFLGILVEHYGGTFPLWLAPVQVKILSISEKHEAYCKEVFEKLRAQNIRADLDLHSSKISYKIREAEQEKTPYMAIVGDKEVESRQVAVRAHGKRDLGPMNLEQWINNLKTEILNKKNLVA